MRNLHGLSERVTVPRATESENTCFQCLTGAASSCSVIIEVGVPQKTALFTKNTQKFARTGLAYILSTFVESGTRRTLQVTALYNKRKLLARH